MADDVTTPAGGTGTGAPATPATPPTTEVAAPSHRDWNAMAANQRLTMEAVSNLAKTLEGLLPKLAPAAAPPKTESAPPAPTTPPADASGLAALTAQVTALQRDNAIKTAIADHGFSGELRTTFEDLTANATADQVKTIAEKMARLKPTAGTAAAPVAPTTPAPTVKPGTSNAGPAAPGAAPLIPDRLEDIPKEVLRTMSAKEIRDKYEAQKRAMGQGNPFAAARNQR